MKLRTSKAAADYSGLPAKLINSVARQLGDKERLGDVFNHGADAGYPNFTYYPDTWKCYVNNRNEINERVVQQADELGEDPVQMVLNWRCVAGEAPKPPKRPTEPKAPQPLKKPRTIYELPEGLDLEEIKETLWHEAYLFEIAWDAASELKEEWGDRLTSLSHDSITCPAMEIEKLLAEANRADKAHQEASEIWALAMYQRELKEYAEAQEEYKKAMAKYQDQLDDWRREMVDRSVDQKLIRQAIYGGRLTDAHTTICNALAWFALEEVARAVVIDE